MCIRDSRSVTLANEFYKIFTSQGWRVTLEPVSYTHLKETADGDLKTTPALLRIFFSPRGLWGDVYKRQAFERRVSIMLGYYVTTAVIFFIMSVLKTYDLVIYGDILEAYKGESNYILRLITIALMYIVTAVFTVKSVKTYRSNKLNKKK